MNRLPILILALLMTALPAMAKPGKALADTTLDPWSEYFKVEAMLNDTAGHFYSVIRIHQIFDTTNLADTSNLIVQKALGDIFSITEFPHPPNGLSKTIEHNSLMGVSVSYDSVITLSPPGTISSRFMPNLFGPNSFRQYIQSLTVTPVGNKRKLVFQFDALAPFEQFEVTYDTTTLHPSKIEYQVRNLPYDETPPAVIPREKTTFVFGNRTPAYFFLLGPGRFVVKKNGQWELHPDYADYTLINELNQ